MPANPPSVAQFLEAVDEVLTPKNKEEFRDAVESLGLAALSLLEADIDRLWTVLQNTVEHNKKIDANTMPTIEAKLSTQPVDVTGLPTNTMPTPTPTPTNKVAIDMAMRSIQVLRDHGYAVAMIPPEHLRGVNPAEVEFSMREDADYFIDINEDHDAE